MNWIPKHSFVVVGAVAVVLLILTTFAIVQANQALDAQCAEMMGFARTSRDSLDAKIACGKIKSEAAVAGAIWMHSGR